MTEISCLVVIEIPPFHLWKAFVVSGRKFSMAGKLSSESGNTLCNRSGYRKFVTAVRCSRNDWKAVWWSQKYHLSMCRRGLWKTVFHGWKTIQMESVDTLFHCNGHRKFVAMVRCSGNDWKAAWWSQRYHLSMCGMGLWSVEEFSIGGNGRKRYHGCLYSIRYSAAC